MWKVVQRCIYAYYTCAHITPYTSHVIYVIFLIKKGQNFERKDRITAYSNVPKTEMQNMSFCLSLIVELTEVFNTETGKPSSSTNPCAAQTMCFSQCTHSTQQQLSSPHPLCQARGWQVVLYSVPPLLLSQAALSPPVPLGCESASAMLRRLMERL